MFTGDTLFQGTADYRLPGRHHLAIRCGYAELPEATRIYGHPTLAEEYRSNPFGQLAPTVRAALARKLATKMHKKHKILVQSTYRKLVDLIREFIQYQVSNDPCRKRARSPVILYLR